LAIAATACIGFGVAESDCDRLREFGAAVDRWQRNPDFRRAGQEYVEFSNDAMRTHVCGARSSRIIMFLRSLPFLPQDYRVNPTSGDHYANFTEGPLSAYLFLSNEQNIPIYTGILTDLAKQGATDEAVRTFLEDFKMPHRVVTDEGAVRSVGRLIDATDAANGFRFREKIGPALQPHIAAVAARSGIPTTPEQMSPAQQREVLQKLDDEIAGMDYDLWKTKQVTDFLNGVWAQVYGADYKWVIGVALQARAFCRIACPVLIALAAGLLLRRLFRAPASEPETASGEGEPGPAVPAAGEG